MPPRHKIDNTVSLHVNGFRYEGWTDIRVSRGLGYAAASLQAQITTAGWRDCVMA
jgi:prophage tail gpP-like protein